VLTSEGGGVRVEIELRAAGPGGTRRGDLEREHPR